MKINFRRRIPRHPVNRGLAEPQSWFGLGDEDKHPCERAFS
jgi:hypothetical protein